MAKRSRTRTTWRDVAQIARERGLIPTSDERPKKAPIPQGMSEGEAMLALQLRLRGLPLGEAEYRFHPERLWRFDRAWPAIKFAVEIEGVTHDGGRHQRIDGFQKDLEKYEAAMLDGWTVYRVSTAMVKSGRALGVIRQMHEVAEWRKWS